ncbi:ROK family transcriptional regulator [uncultured Hydrogenophaga sp.]|uniref:ROK family transcriptional regulator n=1 Tax=uncultured Hydrogenophaga sp. TaxID=199683 RepID=UPI002589F16F|nr:ROK family transcriptional regulator [uncultured Hydrogenophaga sp.]
MSWKGLKNGEKTLLDHVFWASGISRDALAAASSFSKSRANAAVAELLEQGLLEPTGELASTGGRRAETLRLSRSLGVLIGVAVGATGLEVGILSPDLTVLAHHSEPADVRDGPVPVLARIRALMRELLAQCGVLPRQVIAIGIGLPGPVDFDTGQLVNPPLMPQWDAYSIRDDIATDFAAPVPTFTTRKFCRLRCHCGNLGCVEAMAAGPAIARMATEAAEAGQSPLLARLIAERGPLRLQDVAEASRAGDMAANQVMQRAGAYVGQMLASVVNFFNPSHVFIGGGITRVGPLFLAAVRQSVYHRSLALSTRHLEIQYTPLGERAGLIGAGVLAMQESLRQMETA